jgi:serralysin
MAIVRDLGGLRARLRLRPVNEFEASPLDDGSSSIGADALSVQGASARAPGAATGGSARPLRPSDLVEADVATHSRLDEAAARPFAGRLNGDDPLQAATADWGRPSHAIRCLCPMCTTGATDPEGPPGNNPDAKEVWDLEQIVWNFVAPSRRWANNTLTFGFFETNLLPSYGGEGTNNFVPFNPTQRNFARLALRTWADVAGVTFVEVAAGTVGDIMFGNTDTGPNSQAYAYYPSFTGSAAASGDVWMNSTIASNFDPQIGTYPYVTLIHELGHALGLPHPGPYNAGAGGPITYDNSALYRQDTQMYSVMSYFSASITGANWRRPDTNQWVNAQTPMIHDILAIQRLYGTGGATRASNTTYGFNASSEITGAALVGGINPHRIYDFTQNPFPVIAIWDSGGIDTIDLSGFTRANRLDLNWGAFSDVNGMVSNVSIAYGANIENGVGGSGADRLIGNRLANLLIGLAGDDTLLGGAGNDVLRGGLGSDSLDGGDGMDIVIFDGVRAQATITEFSGGFSVTVTGVAGVDTLSANIERIIFTSDVNTRVFRDFNNDFKTDLVSRSFSGSSALYAFEWDTSASGSFRNSGFFRNSGTGVWRSIAGLGDFGGDGRTDVLVFDAGLNRLSIASQIVAASGAGGLQTDTALTSVAGLDWRVMGCGDFNADGRSDIAWRNVDGSIAVWLMDGVNVIGAGITAALGHDWSLALTADWNGDGRTDFIFRHVNGMVAVWAMNGTAIGTAQVLGSVGQAINLEAAVDLDGDARADLVFNDWSANQIFAWRNTAGGLVTTGALIQNGTQSFKGVGDFNGDGFGDIVLQSATGGRTLHWLGDPGAGQPWRSFSWSGALFQPNDIVDFRRANPFSFQVGARHRGWSNLDGMRTINFGGATASSSDIVFLRRFDGQVDAFLNTGSTVVATTTGLAPTRGLEWTLVGQGDFNGDGSSIDLLYHRADGRIAVDTYDAATGAWANLATSLTMSAARRIDAVGDHNGDGFTDIFWRDMNGDTVVSTFGASPAVTTLSGAPNSREMEIQGAADFDGDGRADPVYRSSRGREIALHLSGPGATTTLSTNPGSTWEIAGFGDFDADGRADIFWRNIVTNDTAIWFMNGVNLNYAAYIAGGNPSIDWQVQGVGDLNADGRADIVWRNASGQYSLWYMNGFSISGVNLMNQYANAWQTIGKTAFFSGSA